MRYVLLLAVILVSACVGTQAPATKALAMNMDANPPQVFSGSAVTISVDLENHDSKTISGVKAEIFETGSLLQPQGGCRKDFGGMEPKDFKTFACGLRAPMTERDVDSMVWARAWYGSTLSAAQTFSIFSQSEVEMREKSAKPIDNQRSFTFKDSNIEITMELSNAPLIDLGRKEFVTFKIRNIGSGFIEKLAKSDITIRDSMKRLGTCPETDIYIIGREFPRFSCYLNLDGSTAGFAVDGITIGINYDYEIRDSIGVRTMKGGAAADAYAPTTTSPPTSGGPAPVTVPAQTRGAEPQGGAVPIPVTDTKNPKATISVTSNPAAQDSTISITVTGEDETKMYRLGAYYGNDWHYCYCDGSAKPACYFNGKECSETWKITETAGTYRYSGNAMDAAGNSDSAESGPILFH